MNSLILAVCLSAPPAPCPECVAAGYIAAPPPAVVATVPAPKAVPVQAASSSVTTTVRVRTTFRERAPARQFTPVRATVGVVRRVVGMPVRVVRGAFGGGC